MGEFAGGVILSALISVLIKGVIALTGHSIAWGWAILMAVIFVFVGWFVFDSDWID